MSETLQWTQTTKSTFVANTDTHHYIVSKIPNADRDLGKQWQWHVFSKNEKGQVLIDPVGEGTCYRVWCAKGCASRWPNN